VSREVVWTQVGLELDEAPVPDQAVVLSHEQLPAEVARHFQGVPREEVGAEQPALRSLYTPAAFVRRVAWWRRFSR
jgi:hypothetical protein